MASPDTTVLPRVEAPRHPGVTARRSGQVGRISLGVALSVAGGLALWLAFPPHDLRALAIAAPAALALAAHRRRARTGAMHGLLLGLAFLVPLLSWTGEYVGSGPWLALAVYQALHYAALGAATALVSRLPLWPLWSASLWVAMEAVRSRWLFGGFPWARLGFSQPEGPFTALAALGGLALVSFAVALTGCLLARALLLFPMYGAGSDLPTGGRARACTLAALAAVSVPLVGTLAQSAAPSGDVDDGGRRVTVAVVQGNVPRAGLDFNAQRRAVLDNHVQETMDLTDSVDAGEQPAPDLVIWPENASDIDPLVNRDADRAITAAAQAIGAPILVGAVLEGPGDNVRNAGIVWDPEEGPGDSYVKRHPVPFGEYIPARSFFRLFSDTVDLVRRDFIAGAEPGVLTLGGATLGDLICFEVAYDEYVTDVVRGGAGMLVVQTNNATFGYTAESEQQLAMGRLRAVEHGRPVVVAATSGISAIIGPDGRLVDRSALFTADTFVRDIAQRGRLTVATRLGLLPEWSLSALGLAGAVVALRSRVRGRSRRTTSR